MLVKVIAALVFVNSLYAAPQPAIQTSNGVKKTKSTKAPTTQEQPDHLREDLKNQDVILELNNEEPNVEQTLEFYSALPEETEKK